MTWRLVGRVRGRDLAVTLDEGEQVVGSGPEASVRLRDSTVSRRHAVVHVTTEGIEVEDLGSKNGTWIAGERIAGDRVEREPLASGAELRFGMVTLELQQLDDEDGEVAIRLAGEKAAESTFHSWHPETEEGSVVDEWLERRLPDLIRRAPEGNLQQLAADGGSSLAALEVVDGLRIERLGEDEVGILYLGEACGEMAVDSAVDLAARLGDLALTARCTNCALASRLEVAARGLLVALQVARGEAGGTPSTDGEAPPLPEPASSDPGMISVYARAARAARSEIPTVILGETGSGKELLARYLHDASPRSRSPFVDVNCAALPRDLLEAELFGIEKGVATGVDSRPGRFEQAHGGTLFLDEIADMPLETQAMILRVLQEREVRRIGGTKIRPADVLVLSATNRRLEQTIDAGSFRQDLYYRLAGWSVEVPPLRARRRDLPALASWFAGREAKRLGRSIRGISKAALDRLAAFDWPGNVRQLEQEMRRAVAFTAKGGLIDTRALSADVLAGPSDAPGLDLAGRLQRYERIEIERALQNAGGDVEDAAKRLGISRATLYRRFKSLGIEPP